MTWRPRRLDQLGEVSRGRSRHRPRDADHLYDGPYPFIQTGDVKHAGLYITEHTQTYSEAGLEQSKLWPAGTLCITIAANIADTSILQFDACFPDSVIGFTPRETEADARFVKYLFDATIQRRVQQFTQGAAQDNLSQEKLLSIEFLIPEVDRQRRIADVLSAYDDLIANNRRRMSLLEEAARQLYREWFVRLRFPGHEHTAIVNGVPEGWRRETLLDCVTFLSGGTPSKQRNDYWDGDIPWVSSGEMTDSRLYDTPLRVTQEGADAGSHLVPAETILIVVRGMSLAKEFRVATIARAMTFNQDLKALECGKGVDPIFLFHYLLDRKDYIRDLATEASHGTKKLETPVLERLPVLVPDDRMQRLFAESVAPFTAQRDNLHHQNQKLRAARDLLLPRLMSGEIAV